VADDDSPGKTPPPEVITFGADGSYRVSGNGEPFNGRFRVDGEDVVLTVLVEGTTRAMRRGFKLDAKGLHFANTVQGSFAHYTRIKP
jgi:hypothetical protein